MEGRQENFHVSVRHIPIHAILNMNAFDEMLLQFFLTACHARCLEHFWRNFRLTLQLLESHPGYYVSL